MSDIKKIRKAIDLFDHQDAVSYLKAVFDHVKSLRRAYNLKSFSKDLGFGDNNTMAQVHSGHRSLSEKAAERISDHIGLNRPENKFFLTLVELRQLRNQNSKEEKMALMLELQSRHSKKYADVKELDFFNDWHHAVVFELLDTQQSRSAEEICLKFAMPIEVAEVNQSLELLMELNLAREEPPSSGRFIKTKKDFSAGKAVPGMAIVRFHQEMMNLAKASLTNTPPQQRDISSVTIAVDEKTVARIKEDIRLFRQYLLFLGSQLENPEKVMQVNVQLFPISR